MSETDERVDVEYHLTISVPEDEPAPTRADIADAIAGACDISLDAIRVTSEGGAL